MTKYIAIVEVPDDWVPKYVASEMSADFYFIKPDDTDELVSTNMMKLVEVGDD